MGSSPQALTSHDTGPAAVRVGNATSQILQLLHPALARLPVWPLQMAFSRLVGKVFQRHPGLAARLLGLGNARILVEATDLPIAFLVTPGENPPELRVLRRDQVIGPIGARIRGSLKDLIDLVEGKADGDALFFSRQLEIEGETEIVVLLRNVLDGGSIDLRKEVLAVCGLPDSVIERAIRHADMAVSKLRRLNRSDQRAGKAIDPMAARDE